jgi:hypothetical protein
MDIMDIIGAAPSIAVAQPEHAGAERATYLEPDGSVSESVGTPRLPARGDVAMTAGALALLAVAGLVGMRYLFKGALP